MAQSTHVDLLTIGLSIQNAVFFICFICVCNIKHIQDDIRRKWTPNKAPVSFINLIASGIVSTIFCPEEFEFVWR